MKKSMSDPDYRRIRRGEKKPFNFEITEAIRDKLHAVAHYRAQSMGATLRQLILISYAMQLDDKPICANGQNCLMPHLHAASHPTSTEGEPGQ